MTDITFVQGVGLMLGGAMLFWIVGQIVNRNWRRFVNSYLDRHPDVEEQLYRQYGKVRKDKPWDAVRVDNDGRALESSGEWVRRIDRGSGTTK